MRRRDVICFNCGKVENVPNSRAKNYKYCSLLCMKKQFSRTKIEIGTLINNWKVLDDYSTRKNGRSYIRAQCTCGSEIIKLLPISHYTSKKHKGCEMCSMFHTSNGYELISGEFWSCLKSSAEKRNIKFDITIQDIWELFINQNKKCALSGVDIIFYKNTTEYNRSKRRLKTASLDRIDSSKGYTLDNIQWVHKDVNRMKNKYNQKYFIEICKKIAKNN